MNNLTLEQMKYFLLYFGLTLSVLSLMLLTGSTYLTVSNVGITLFGCPAFLLVIRDTIQYQKIGTILGFCSNPFWWWMMIITDQWFTLPIHLLYTWGWFDKAYRLWYKKS